MYDEKERAQSLRQQQEFERGRVLGRGAMAGAGAGQIAQQAEIKRRSEIDRELARLAQSSEGLAMCVDLLWTRLAPVLAPSPAVNGAPGIDGATESCTSDLGGALQRQAAVVDNAAASLRNLMAALAL
jgi:hypothetical protein